MPSVVDICNMALSHLRAPAITSLTESSHEATECNRHYASVRDAVLEDYPWNFAEKQLALGLTTESRTGWAFVYQYPPDCIKALKIYNAAGDSAEPIDFKIVTNTDLNAKRVLTAVASAELVYTARVETTNLFSAQFVKALAAGLAAELAIPIRGDAELKQVIAESYSRIVRRAEVVNAQESRDKPAQVSSILNSRR